MDELARTDEPWILGFKTRRCARFQRVFSGFLRIGGGAVVAVLYGSMALSLLTRREAAQGEEEEVLDSLGERTTVSRNFPDGDEMWARLMARLDLMLMVC
ncbi:hypothetical protein K0M31_017654 [Melipona bicolor]|uniref:Uncharacterized protein n=1 Tax=Melipona bicolor TaxID=60889 RepID=A0AA40KSN1_9HYME|nr:hypothetical protein K0M31_017654 [Melipona bicolor]